MTDTALNCLVAIARFHQLPAEPEQLDHQFSFPGETFTDVELLQAAKALTLKAKQLKSSVQDLKNTVLPAIVKHKGESLQQKFDSSWFIPSLIKYRKLFYEVLKDESLRER